MQKDYGKIQAEDAEIIAISSDNLADTKRTVQNQGIQYIVLSDSDKQAITAYNVVDPNNNRLARPASYILKTDGTIAWKYIDIRLGDRVPTAQILSELGKL